MHHVTQPTVLHARAAEIADTFLRELQAAATDDGVVFDETQIAFVTHALSDAALEAFLQAARLLPTSRPAPQTDADRPRSWWQRTGVFYAMAIGWYMAERLPGRRRRDASERDLALDADQRPSPAPAPDRPLSWWQRSGLVYLMAIGWFVTIKLVGFGPSWSWWWGLLPIVPIIGMFGSP